VGGWISQFDEIVKDHTSCGDFSACLWPLVHGPQQNSELVCQNTKGRQDDPVIIPTKQ
jgi:hypothetical protein